MSITFFLSVDRKADAAPAVITARQLAAFRAFARERGQLLEDEDDDPLVSCSFEARVCPWSLASICAIFDHDVGVIAVVEEAQFSVASTCASGTMTRPARSRCASPAPRTAQRRSISRTATPSTSSTRYDFRTIIAAACPSGNYAKHSASPMFAATLVASMVVTSNASTPSLLRPTPVKGYAWSGDSLPPVAIASGSIGLRLDAPHSYA